MPRVILAGSQGREFTGGLGEFDVSADTSWRRLILELDQRFLLGLGEYVERRMAIAIDGEIHQDAHGAELERRQRSLPDPQNRRG